MPAWLGDEVRAQKERVKKNPEAGYSLLQVQHTMMMKSWKSLNSMKRETGR
jgi:hypothetical protein